MDYYNLFSIKTASCTALLVVDVDKPKGAALRDGI